ncbi:MULTISPECIES: 4-hydroxy-2-oxoheptanedioate aldolase [Acinetobacter]|uniref:4-hydroxy-2-oxoheptanedioate aldolase n=1 Tax=Acinetobacter TaxID=469 RepID=UPI000E105B88|nr:MULTISPECIES: 4-hydroxy-2-oxoheptanedioate aldolase [Acinetobacter]MCG6037481.1 4-hydroxy-2-oxoheptanedioate aldolase [Acinetobacter baumannii]AXJ90724.1 4-hydroxy-2-oxoheptanedioate aldolase [Acinetobacter pittii]MBE2173826.1 4-hydroxy-2-oxoheptanedioate aldolase [Acinetobacter oleivorans]MBN6513248.1 4-hydroxy-2-oxoheptanedioate aldolase [Acinetobacter pittii]HCH7477818.1 4-hydroxy-2-oxoheptanedioate aldolase [Acinetobacter baumannii]
MVTAVNYFKQKLKTEQQIGIWVGLADGYSAEIAANAGYDWLLIDGEHAPNDVRSILAQLQSVAAYPSQAIVRPVSGDVPLIKQLLDIGAQTLLIPMIESAEQAELMVKATRYPPDGIRGVGAALARASRWNNISDYLQTADEQICVLVQVESKKGLDNLDEILKVHGVDGVFIGPADLSAALGYRGNPGHEYVQNIIVQTIQKIRAAGKAAGILSADEKLVKQYLELGTEFVAVGVDTSLLMKSMKQLLSKFKNVDEQVSTSPSVY